MELPVYIHDLISTAVRLNHNWTWDVDEYFRITYTNGFIDLKIPGYKLINVNKVSQGDKINKVDFLDYL